MGSPALADMYTMIPMMLLSPDRRGRQSRGHEGDGSEVSEDKDREETQNQFI